jgi:hypothetical protein
MKGDTANCLEGRRLRLSFPVICSNPIYSAIVPPMQQAILAALLSLALLALGGLLLRRAR